MQRRLQVVSTPDTAQGRACCTLRLSRYREAACTAYDPRFSGTQLPLSATELRFVAGTINRHLQSLKQHPTSGDLDAPAATAAVAAAPDGAAPAFSGAFPFAQPAATVPAAQPATCPLRVVEGADGVTRAFLPRRGVWRMWLAIALDLVIFPWLFLDVLLATGRVDVAGATAGAVVAALFAWRLTRFAQVVCARNTLEWSAAGWRLQQTGLQCRAGFSWLMPILHVADCSGYWDGLVGAKVRAPRMHAQARCLPGALASNL